jgi:AraC family transcriptional activator of mtrCDE
MDWLSRLFDMMPVRGRLDLRCAYRAPWRIDQGPGEPNEIPYHAIVSGSALLEDPAGGRPLQLKAGDIVLLPGNPRHVMHDGSGARTKPARNRQELNLVVSENAGKGERLDLLCGYFAIAPPHDRLLRNYLPPRLVVHAGTQGGEAVNFGTAEQLKGLVSLMRRPGYLRSSAIHGWHRRSRRSSTSRRGHGRCRSLLVSATCRGPRWRVNSTRSSDGRPAIC